MEMPDLLPCPFAWFTRRVNSIRHQDEGLTFYMSPMEIDRLNKAYKKYKEDNAILKAKDAEIASLHLEIDECHKRLNRWADAHEELIGEVELRKRIAELETFIEARGFDKI